jgi:hypothetical protein
MHPPGKPPVGDALRSAMRWLSAEGRHDAAAIEEACRRFDLSPLDEEFLLAEARRTRTTAAGDDPESPVDPEGGPTR